MISKELEGTLKTAIKEAQGRSHEYLCLEHLLYALLQDKDTSRAIIICGGDIERLRKSLEEFFNGELETLPAGFDQEPQQTLSFHRVLQRAVIHAQSADRKEINGGNLLIAMFRESDSYAVYLLEDQGITRFDVVNYVSHGISKISTGEDWPQSEQEHDDEEKPAQRVKPLQAFTVNLVNKAGQGSIDPLIGRDDEIERTIHVLCRRRKNNPIYVGDPGVGKTALASVELKCIGSTTYHYYKSYFERDRALARRFQKIEIPEPSVDEAYKILQGLKPHYEKHHGVHYSTTALHAAVELSAKHINDRRLPDKAIDVIDEVGAAVKILPPEKRKKIIGPKDIEKMVAKIAKIPLRSVSTSDREQLQNLERDLKLTVFGQDAAVEILASTIKLSRSGLGHPEKPIGCFLFSGPTGVGKTEMAKQLAHTMGIEFIRFDMSEYMEKHTVSRLIGAPPGYVGFDQGGLLTDAINKSPYAVLLLDEIEKAHPDLFNILLQVMDHATLTDNNGRKADFRNVILIMTTNAGAREMSGAPLGLGAQANVGKGKEAIEKMFSPEFRNRLDAMIVFNSLSMEIIERVVDKFIIELDRQLNEKKVFLNLTAKARRWFAERGYDPTFGARPMARLIQNEIKRVLADDILFGKLQNGGKVTVDENEGKLTFEYSALTV